MNRAYLYLDKIFLPIRMNNTFSHVVLRFTTDYSTLTCQISQIKNSISDRIMRNTCAFRRQMRWARLWTAQPIWALNVSTPCECCCLVFTNRAKHSSSFFPPSIDAPEDISVSENIVYVQEHHIPGRVICKSQADPGKWIASSSLCYHRN